MTELYTVPLQLSWFFQYRPEWLAIVLIYSGVVLLGTGSKHIDRYAHLGFAFMAIPAVVYLDRVLAVVLICLGSWVEGALTVRFYMKVHHALSRRNLPHGSGLRKRILFYGTVLFVALVGIWGVVYVGLTSTPTEDSVYKIAVIWTIVTIIISFIGLLWKLQLALYLDNLLVLSGLILMIVGASIFNIYGLMENITLYFASIGAYSVGFWMGMIWYVRRIRNPRIAVSVA